MRIPASNPQSSSPLLPVWFTVPLCLLTSILLTMLLSILVYMSFGIFSWNYPFLLQLALNLAMLLSVLGGAVLFLRYLDRRPITDMGLSFKGRMPDVLLAIGFAVLLYVIGFGVTLLLGSVKIISVHFDGGMLIGSFVLFIIAALGEEIMLRGYMLSRLMSYMNKFVALFVSSIVFALLHIFNPNVDLLSILNIFLAGLLLGSAFMYTHNLSFSLVLHIFWNWLQGSVLGFEVSGTSFGSSLLTLKLSDQRLLNGGNFGFEGSIICTALLILATMSIIYFFERKKQIQ